MNENNYEKVRAFAPASVANVGCGFDVLGFAIDDPGDEVVAELAEQAGIEILSVDGDEGRLPLETDRNTAGVAVRELLKELKADKEIGINLRIYKKMPLGSGLGSSAASSVAAVVAVNHLLGDPFSTKELLSFAVEAERVASGTPHADNVAASLFGGFILVRSNDPLDVISLDTPEKLHCTVIHPRIEIRTEDTRKILRQRIPLAKAVIQWGNVGGLIAGLLKSDYELIGRSLHDEIVEPIRSVLIPGYDDLKQAALKAGALGCSISGSGPSVFALSTSKKQAREVGKAMSQVLNAVGLESDLYVSMINRQGAAVIKDTQPSS